jgi:hypothetical protein
VAKEVSVRYLIATDTGGTFTDVAVYDREAQKVTYGKTLTNYGDLIDGVLDGLSTTDAKLDDALLFKHGTTHVINTFIQRSGARTALVATRGFADMIEIGRGNRPVPFALKYMRDAPLIERPDRFEVDERIDAAGKVLRPLDREEIRRLARRIRETEFGGVAVSFINAYANPSHEEEAVAILREELPGVYVTSGTILTREWFEYERSSTAAANAYVGSRTATPLRTLHPERSLLLGRNPRNEPQSPIARGVVARPHPGRGPSNLGLSRCFSANRAALSPRSSKQRAGSRTRCAGSLRALCPRSLASRWCRRRRAPSGCIASSSRIPGARASDLDP